MRDVFGNPFRPLCVDPALRTPLVVGLAQAAYDERIMPSGELDPIRLAVLADALEDAGAPSALVDHLRGTAAHVRGRHVIDVLTGRF